MTVIISWAKRPICYGLFMFPSKILFSNNTFGTPYSEEEIFYNTHRELYANAPEEQRPNKFECPIPMSFKTIEDIQKWLDKTHPNTYIVTIIPHPSYKGFSILFKKDNKIALNLIYEMFYNKKKLPTYWQDNYKMEYF